MYRVWYVLGMGCSGLTYKATHLLMFPAIWAEHKQQQREAEQLDEAEAELFGLHNRTRESCLMEQDPAMMHRASQPSAPLHTDDSNSDPDDATAAVGGLMVVDDIFAARPAAYNLPLCDWPKPVQQQQPWLLVRAAEADDVKLELNQQRLASAAVHVPNPTFGSRWHS